MVRLRELYKSKIIPELTKEFSYKNPMAVPQMKKVVISMGIGRATQDKKFLELAKKDLTILVSNRLRNDTVKPVIQALNQ